MISADKAPPPKMHVARRAPGTGGFAQYVKFIVVGVIILLLVVIVIASATRRTPKRVARQARARVGRQVSLGEPTTTIAERRAMTKSARAEMREKARRERLEERRRRREERRRLRLERRRGTRRASRGSYTARRSTTPILSAIVPQPTGELVAVVGERQVKPGDQIEGRKIVEVSSDRVKVEYFTKSYEVKLGQPLY